MMWKDARAAYELAIDSGHPDEAPKAEVRLGALLEAQGDLEGAAAAYQLAIDSGHREQSPRAALLLGALLAAQGNPEGARAAFQRQSIRVIPSMPQWRYSILGSPSTGKGM